MPGLLSLSRLVPEGFHVESVEKTGNDEMKRSAVEQI